jgi:hypothetical protein
MIVSAALVVNQTYLFTFLRAAAGQALQPLTDIGLGLLDMYLLEGLLKGWQPKLFINEYQKIAERPQL